MACARVGRHDPGAMGPRFTRFVVQLALAAFVVGLIGCTVVRTWEDGELRVGEARTYAWSAGVADPVDEEVPWDEILGAISNELRERGLEEAPRADADLLVDAEVEVGVVTVEHDPNYDLYVAERVERATLAIEVRRRSPDTVNDRWRGVCRHRLRVVERSMGGVVGSRWHAVDEERDWSVGALVRRILDRLPD